MQGNIAYKVLTEAFQGPVLMLDWFRTIYPAFEFFMSGLKAKKIGLTPQYD